MRGWIAFVAFIELSNAIRCFIDEEKFLQGNVFNSGADNEKGKAIINMKDGNIFHKTHLKILTSVHLNS